jgi:hypothetical protein
MQSGNPYCLAAGDITVYNIPLTNHTSKFNKISFNQNGDIITSKEKP